MAALMDGCLDNKLTSFRRILHNTVIDNNAFTEIYSEHDMSVIRDLTSCLRITENRYVWFPERV